MAIYEMTPDAIRPIGRTTFREAKIQERANLQRLLRDRIEVIAPDCLVLAEEFGEWEDSRRRIDLLAIDTDANFVVIELKRTEDGGHMELQAVRYAAMVSTMTFEQAVASHKRYLAACGRENDDAESGILEHLGWDEPNEDEFGQEVRIVLAAAEFSRELTTAVIWLNERGLDIRCVRIIPYEDTGRILLDVQQVIPLPEAEEYQVRVREKTRKERESRQSSRDLTKYVVSVRGVPSEPLSKREAVYRVIKHLCDNGVSPREIQSRVSFRSKNSFRAAPGTYRSEDAFVAAVTQIIAEKGRRFDARRWYTGDDERIECDGHTYAVSNQWGPRALEWAHALIALFPGHEVDIRPATNE